MSSLSISGATIAFSLNDVREVNINESVKLCWVVLQDGTQINIPLEVIICAYQKIKVEPPRIL